MYTATNNAMTCFDSIYTASNITALTEWKNWISFKNVTWYNKRKTGLYKEIHWPADSEQDSLAWWWWKTFTGLKLKKIHAPDDGEKDSLKRVAKQVKNTKMLSHCIFYLNVQRMFNK
jgi:hypothetical protein